MMVSKKLTSKVINAAMEVHTALGPGLLESVYQECLCYNLKKRGIRFEREKPIPVVYEEVKLDCGYRIDVVVENQLVVELKSIEAFNDIHLAQILTYLKLANYTTGLLFNFNVTHLRNGIKRVVNSR